MRILVVIPSFYPAVIYGGTIFSSFNTCKELAALGHDVRVSTTNTNMYKRLDVPVNKWTQVENIQVKYYNETIVDKFSLALLLNLWRDIRNTQIVHIQAVFNTPTPIALFCAKILGKPIVLSPRGVMGDWIMNQGSTFKKLWLRMLIKPFANSIVWHATAIQERDEIKAHFPKAKVEVVPNGIDLAAFEGMPWLTRKEYIKKYTGIEFGNDTKVIVSLGRIHVKKGFNYLIEAITQVPENTLLLIGGQDEGELANLSTLVNKLGLEKRVFFVGEISIERKKEFLMHSDVFALTSHNENFGNVYAEALASGIPIIASIYTPWSEVEVNNCGSWIDLDATKIAAALNHWLMQDKEKNILSCRTYIAPFGWNQVAIKLEKIFSELKP